MNAPHDGLSQLIQKRSTIPVAWMTIGDPYLTELVSSSGAFAAIVFDLQHGLIDASQAVNCIRAVNAVGGRTMVRLPKLDESLIGFLLDAGVDGLILPQTNTPDEADRFIAACHYPPRGIRSFGPTRQHLVGRESFVTFCMIETAGGLAEVEGIAATDGLDGLFIGPGDLGISIGIGPGQDRSEPEFLAAVETVKAAAGKNGKALGIHANSVEYAARLASQDFQLVTSWVDVVAINQSIQRTTETWARLTEEP